MRSLKTLLAGPWVGEFGWELFGWQSYLRSLSKQFSHVIISSRTSSRYLYHDFCNEFISFESSFENTNYHTNKNIVSDPLSILRCDKRIMSNKLSGDQEFIEYGTKQKDYLFDVVIHARNLKTKTKRNWDIQKWNKIAQECDKKNYKVCCVGLSDYTHLVHPFIDKRDVDLESLSNILRNSRLIIGPSSGVMHFATLCRCPQLTWTQNEDGKDRYCRRWNPFSTKTKIILSNNPDLETVSKELDIFMQQNS